MTNRPSPSLQHPIEELYFSIVGLACAPERLPKERPRLLDLLAQAVLERTMAGHQQQCEAITHALLTGDIGKATKLAALMVQKKLAVACHSRAVSEFRL